MSNPSPGIPAPVSEPNRLSALHDSRMLAARLGRAFDDLTELAARSCGASIGLLVLDHPSDRSAGPQLVASFGIEPTAVPQNWIGSIAPAGERRLDDGPGRAVRFSVGAPLLDDDDTQLGALWVIDERARTPSDNARRQVELLGRQAGRLLHAHDVMQTLDAQNQRAAGDASPSREDSTDETRDLIPMCSHCHAVRDESDTWARIEDYLTVRSTARVSHGVCPPCFDAHYSPAALDRVAGQA